MRYTTCMKTAFVVCCLLLAVYCLPSGLSAYTETSTGPEILVTLSPANPGANQQVTATLQSFALDLDRSDISWYVDEVKKDSGPARKTFSFRMGPAGEELRLSVHVETPDGIVAEKVLTMNPANVDLVWEAVTYAPPLYKGKAQPSPGSLIRVVALPSFTDNRGGAVGSEKLIYEWQKDFSKDFGASGRGKSSFTFTMSDGLASTDISVRVSDESGVLVAENKLSLSPKQPIIRLYEEHPLEGTLYERAINNTLSMRATEFTLRAEPFGLYASGAPLDYAWQVDSSVATPHNDARNLLTLRQDKGTSGSSALSLSISNLAKSLTAATNLVINFGK